VGARRHAPAALSRSVTQSTGGSQSTGGCWAPGPVWAGTENPVPTGIPSPDCPVRSGFIQYSHTKTQFCSKSHPFSQCLATNAAHNTLLVQQSILSTQSNAKRTTVASVLKIKTKCFKLRGFLLYPEIYLVPPTSMVLQSKIQFPS
jgi:hypothetical protein